MKLRFGRGTKTCESEPQGSNVPQRPEHGKEMATEIPSALVREIMGLTADEPIPDAAAIEAAIRAKTATQQQQMPIPPPPVVQPTREREAWASLRISLPTYQGHRDEKTPSEFLCQLERFAASQNMTPTDILTRGVPVALTDAALRWWTFTGGFDKWDTFKEAFLNEFGPVNYRELLKKELDDRTQHPAESLSAFIQTIAGYYEKIGVAVTEETKIERVMRQMHPEFRRALAGRKFDTLRDMAKAGPEIQRAILMDRDYRPPPPAAWSVEPSLAWGDAPRASGPMEMTAVVSRVADFNMQQQDYLHLNAAALDPYMHAHIPAWAPYQQGGVGTIPNAQYKQKDKLACWLCQSRNHFARNCPERKPRREKKEEEVKAAPTTEPKN